MYKIHTKQKKYVEKTREVRGYLVSNCVICDQRKSRFVKFNYIKVSDCPVYGKRMHNIIVFF